MRRIVLFACAFALGSSAQAAGTRFNDEFNASARKSCQASAASDGMPEELAVSYCGCLVASLDKKFAISQKLALTQTQMAPVLKECAESSLKAFRK